MSEGSPIFERIADELQQRSTLSRLETRGTLRLALKEAGLFPKTVTARHLIVVFEKILPPMLQRRGVRNPVSLCQSLIELLQSESAPDSPDEDSPEGVFSRIGDGRASSPSIIPPSFASPSSRPVSSPRSTTPSRSIPPPSIPPPSTRAAPSSSRTIPPPSRTIPPSPRSMTPIPSTSRSIIPPSARPPGSSPSIAPGPDPSEPESRPSRPGPGGRSKS